MKILNVGHNHYVAGGSDRVLIETGELLVANGHEVIPYCAQSNKNIPSRFDSYFPKAINFKKVTFKDLFSFFYNLSAKRSLAVMLESENLNIDILPGMSYSGMEACNVNTALWFGENKCNLQQLTSEYPLWQQTREGKTALLWQIKH